MIPPFVIDFILKTTIYLIIMYATGILVLRKNVKVNYTRKINHFSLMIVPFLLSAISPAPPSNSGSETLLMQAVMLLSGLAFFILFLKPVRDRIPFFKTAFAGIDRPEDRPYTLLWMTTQTAGNFIAVIPISSYLALIGLPHLVFILIFINGVGDGLAEPIGIRFGKHKYQTYALFTKQKYTRSIEGSSVVFLVSILSIILFASGLSTIQITVLLLTLPIVMTVSEAKAPHTWDNPIMFATGSLILYLVLHFL